MAAPQNVAPQNETAHSDTKGSLVLEERCGAVMTLRLNRPERLNALNVELVRELLEALRRLSDDSAVGAVVLTGAGRGFCSGGDVYMLRDARMRHAGKELEGLLYAGKQIILALAGMPKPVVAAVNGPAAGGGMNLALGCDLRVASQDASFGESFAQLGLFPDFGGMYFLPRLVGEAKAAELFYSGEMISASEAARLGMVEHVYAAGEFAAEAQKFAQRLAAAPPLAAVAVKKLLASSQRSELERTLDAEIAQQMVCFASEDCLEGLNAFFEKRKPQFRGR